MVFPGDTSLVSENYNAPLSPQQRENANLESSQLDIELGLKTYQDPSDDENGQESEEDIFSDLNLGETGEKIASVYHGDETKVLYEDIPNKVIADEGAKTVPCSSGQEKDGLTAFLVQNTFGRKLPLFPIFNSRNTKIWVCF